MLFEERHEQIMAKRKPTTKAQLWALSVVFGLVLFLAAIAYLYLQNGYVDFALVNRSLAITAVLVIGSSFSLSGICYFWNFMDTKMIYRKHLGLAGFYFGLLHGLTSLYYYFIYSPTTVNYDFFNVWHVYGYAISNVVAFLFGLLALLIFSLMALISNGVAARELGGVAWRRTLRFGYFAYVALLFHFGIKDFAIWEHWFRTFEPSALPPTSLIMAAVILLVVALRLSLSIALAYHKKLRVQAAAIPPTQQTPNLNAKP